jgi:hypothetical protein
MRQSALCQKQTFVSAAQIPFGCYDSFVTAIIDADFFARVLGNDYVGPKKKKAQRGARAELPRCGLTEPAQIGTPKNDSR